MVKFNSVLSESVFALRYPHNNSETPQHNFERHLCDALVPFRRNAMTPADAEIAMAAALAFQHSLKPRRYRTRYQERFSASSRFILHGTISGIQLEEES